MSDKPPTMSFSNSSSGTSFTESSMTTTATTPEHSQSRRGSEKGTSNAVNQTPSAAVNAARVSAKLDDLKDVFRATSSTTTTSLPAPGSEEGHPIDPLLRVYDPTKDEHLTIEELLARPRLPRAPSERVAAAKLKAVKLEAAALQTQKDAESSEILAGGGKLSTVQLLEGASVAVEEVSKKAADRENHINYIKALGNELNATFEKKR